MTENLLLTEYSISHYLWQLSSKPKHFMIYLISVERGKLALFYESQGLPKSHDIDDYLIHSRP